MNCAFQSLLLLVLFQVSCAGDEVSERTQRSEPFVNSAGAKMLYIGAGEFLMGAGQDDGNAYASEKPAHVVKLTRPFFMSETEVTQAQWRSVMESEPWDGKPFIRSGDSFPATFISWKMAQRFCQQLSEREGRLYRLPTEAEWEYACRAGTKTAYSFGHDVAKLGDYGWFEANSESTDGGRPRKVRQKSPNPFGLYDMHGNVREWCQDWYGEYTSQRQVDPMGPAAGENRIFRGGCWNDADIDCRSSFRDYFQPSDRNYFLGFRLVSELRRDR